MSYEMLEALREIEDMAPMYRREYVMEYVRKHLGVAEAKRILYAKDKKGYFERMVKAGYVEDGELLRTIGKERIEEYFHSVGKES